MHNVGLSASDAFGWVREGFDRVRREPARWLGITLVYVVIALVLKRIPFLGNFVLVLITPIMLAGALLAARAPQPSTAGAVELLRVIGGAAAMLVGLMGLMWFLAGRGGSLHALIAVALLGLPIADAKVRALIGDGARELFQVFRREDYSFAIVIICILTLGLVVLVNIPELLITGGSVVSGLSGGGLIGPLRPSMIIGLVVVIALYVLLAMALIYVIPLTLFGGRQPVPAVAESFRACLVNRNGVALFVVPFLCVNAAIVAGFGASHLLGYALLLLLGVPSLPAFVIGINAGYQALFEQPATAPAASLGTRAAP